MPKVAIFMDGSNLYHGGKRAGLRLDVEKVAHRLLDDRELVRTYYYTATVPQEMDQQVHEAQAKFLAHLDHVPYFEVKLGRLEPRSGGRWVEKGVDHKLATDMVFFAAKDLYDVAVLVSGDGDLAYTVQAVKDLGKHVENAYFREGHSRHLMKDCDKFIELNEKYLKGCLRPKPEAEPVAAPTSAADENGTG